MSWVRKRSIHETGEIKRVVSSLLLQVDALPGYVIIMTPNEPPRLLDRAVWRRFQIRFKLPLLRTNKPRSGFIDWEPECEQELGAAVSTLAKNLKGANFSELEQFGQGDLNVAMSSLFPKRTCKQLRKAGQWEHRSSLADEQEDGELPERPLLILPPRLSLQGRRKRIPSSKIPPAFA
ncbi:MAG: hypothetical protein U5R30_21655 [Deltaproteobacteria bacterium]|nr:hypothetical protein [Deltaproteobacteria bacterium]